MEGLHALDSRGIVLSYGSLIAEIFQNGTCRVTKHGKVLAEFYKPTGNAHYTQPEPNLQTSECHPIVPWNEPGRIWRQMHRHRKAG